MRRRGGTRPPLECQTRGRAEIAAWALAGVQVARLVWGWRQVTSLVPVNPVLVLPDGWSAPSVSLIVPARDEAATIAGCLAAARAQAYPGLEIIVVDDCSEDATAALVEAAGRVDSRVRLIAGAPLPAGWIGKSWALHQGVGAATGDWLLFVDADTELQPGAVAGAVQEAQRREAALLSILTRQVLRTWWERAIQPAVLATIAEAVAPTLVNDPARPGVAFANGQFLLIRRDVHAAIGGHAAVRGEIIEDGMLARRAKRLGWRLWLGDGRRLATTRMYATPGALWEGWTKNLHAGPRLQPWLGPPGLALLVIGALAPYWTIAGAIRRRSPPLAVAAAVQVGALLVQRRLADRAFGAPARYTAAQPLGQLVVLVLFVASFLKARLGRGVTWKRRRYRRIGAEPATRRPGSPDRPGVASRRRA